MYKERKLNLTFPPSYLQQWCVLKSIVRRKTKDCPDPSATVDNYINHEFPHKIEAIKLDLITSEKEAQREIVLKVQTMCAHSSSPRANFEKVGNVMIKRQTNNPSDYQFSCSYSTVTGRYILA